MSDARSPDPDSPSARTLAILDDLYDGMRPAEVARRHGVSLQWVHVLRRRAALPVPPRPPKVKQPAHLKPPKPIPPRTLAIIADVRAGMRYRKVAARHGVTRHHVWTLAKRHGGARSLIDPDWRRHPVARAARIPRDPATATIVDALRAGEADADVAARFGKSASSIENLRTYYGVRRSRKSPVD